MRNFKKFFTVFSLVALATTASTTFALNPYHPGPGPAPVVFNVQLNNTAGKPVYWVASDSTMKATVANPNPLVNSSTYFFLDTSVAWQSENAVTFMSGKNVCAVDYSYTGTYQGVYYTQGACKVVNGEVQLNFN